MSTERHVLPDPRLEPALAELRALIQGKYPAATFSVAQGDDPEGVYLVPTVDVEDVEDVFEVVVDRLLDMQIEEQLPVYVFPRRPLTRVLEDMQTRAAPNARVHHALSLPPEAPLPTPGV